jgi:hypothetical protein
MGRSAGQGSLCCPGAAHMRDQPMRGSGFGNVPGMEVRGQATGVVPGKAQSRQPHPIPTPFPPPRRAARLTGCGCWGLCGFSTPTSAAKKKELNTAKPMAEKTALLERGRGGRTKEVHGGTGYRA